MGDTIVLLRAIRRFFFQNEALRENVYEADLYMEVRFWKIRRK